jgi:hypothetical protein
VERRPAAYIVLIKRKRSVLVHRSQHDGPIICCRRRATASASLEDVEAHLIGRFAAADEVREAHCACSGRGGATSRDRCSRCGVDRAVVREF